MITDVILLIPTIIITYIWDLLAVMSPMPQAITDASVVLGSFLSRLDFIIPIALIGDMLAWYMAMIIAWFFIWTIGVTLAIYNAVKIF